MSNPGVEPSGNDNQDNQNDEAPGVAPVGAAPKKKSWLKRGLAAVAGATVIAIALNQCSDEPAPVPQTPAAAPATPETGEPNANNQRGPNIYRYFVTADTEIHGPGANDPAIAVVRGQSCVEGALSSNEGISQVGNRVEIIAASADGVHQARGFVNTDAIVNYGLRDNSPCNANVELTATTNFNSSVKNDVEAGQMLRAQDNVSLYISHTQTIPMTGIGIGSCVITTGNSGNGRTEFTVAANGREYTLWGDQTKFERITSGPCEAKLTR